MSFHRAQSRAIAHKNGPMLVLAGPGSGKTRVITERTKYLIERHGIDPAKILVVTFTKAAAAEMRERFLALMNLERVPVTFGTFHSVFFYILKAAYGYHSGNIIREEQRYQIIKEAADRQELEIEDEQDFISGLISEISMVKSERIDVGHYYSMNCPEEIFKTIYNEYEMKLRKARMIDFDDMLVFCYELLVQRKDILEAWRNRFQYIMVDETQDANGIQYEIIKMLAAPSHNLFIVGDDDQSIYRFRGAKPEIMLGFPDDYKQAKTIILDINYRCCQTIAESAARLISHNQNRYVKNIQAHHKGGEPVHIKEFETQQDENDAIIKWVRRYQEEGMPYSQMAVLFRSNLEARLLAGKFMEYNIPFKMKDSLPNIYEHWITRNIISYIKIAMGVRERREFLQIANRPNRYISRECLDEAVISFDQIRKFYEERTWMEERIDKFESDINLLETMTPFTAIRYIRRGIGYDEYLKEYARFRRIRLEDLEDVLDGLEAAAKNYANYEAWFLHIEEYGEELKNQSKEQRKNWESVTFTTMHSAKGLEFETVFIIDANEGITPHKKAISDEEIEEERRMFYVAMTRAKQNLHIYYAKERHNKAMEASRFIGELLSLQIKK